MIYFRYAAVLVLLTGTAIACWRWCSKGNISLRRLCPALILALAVYCAVISAIERRLTAGALLPIVSGNAYPLRAAAFSGITLLSAALYTTRQGARLRERLDKAMQKDRWRWLTAALLTGIFFLWITRVSVISFMTNDDVSIMRTIAQIPERGILAAYRSYTHFLFCAILSLFYKIDPHGYWYAFYHLAAIAIALTIISRCVLLKSSRRGLPAIGALGMLALLDAGLMVHTVTELSFTVTPALLGTAAVALVLCRGNIPGRTARIASDLGCLLLMFFCYLQRMETGLCLLCFYGLAAGYQILRQFLARKPGYILRIVSFALSAAVMLGLYIQLDHLTLSASLDNSEEIGSITYGKYLVEEHYRSLVMDYMVENLTNEQLEAVGLPPELSNLLRAWYFMDERINGNTFYQIVQAYYDPSLSENSLAYATSIETDSHLRIMALTTASLPLLLILALIKRRIRRSWPEMLCAFGAIGGAALLSLYLIQQGRFLLRVQLVLVIPAAVTLLLMALEAPAPEGSRPPGKASAYCIAVLLLLLGIMGFASARCVPYAEEAVSRREVNTFQNATEGYANSHQDITFITNFITQNLNPFHDATAYPRNMSIWGGTGVTASSNRMYADAFFRDDVQFMYQNPSTVLALMQYLTLDFGPVQAVSLSQLTRDTFVVDLDQVTPGDNYTGWYEQNGMTYYFREGKPFTGKQIIDGQRYTFTGDGFDGQLKALINDDGIPVYTTTAYSLLSGD